MPQFDLPLSELERYLPMPTDEPDFDEFWIETLDLARRHDLAASYVPVDALLETVDVFDTAFSGWSGQPIAAWLLLPRHRSGTLPAVVEFLGYGNGRSMPYERLLFSAAGYAHLIVDARGQGADGRPGVTPDPDPEPPTGQHPGFLTRGVTDPRTYYYRRLMTDAVRAVEAARTHPQIDPHRVAVYGHSQGGGLALAVSALVPDVAAVLADVPFLCDVRRATEITDAEPYAELAAYVRSRRDDIDLVFRTLSYFDGVSFAARAAAPALFGVALMDEVCPPSTVFAAYNHYTGPKQIRVWPYNGHESGQIFQQRENLAFLREALA